MPADGPSVRVVDSDDSCDSEGFRIRPMVIHSWQEECCICLVGLFVWTCQSRWECVSKLWFHAYCSCRCACQLEISLKWPPYGYCRVLIHDRSVQYTCIQFSWGGLQYCQKLWWKWDCIVSEVLALFVGRSTSSMLLRSALKWKSSREISDTVIVVPWFQWRFWS